MTDLNIEGRLVRVIRQVQAWRCGKCDVTYEAYQDALHCIYCNPSCVDCSRNLKDQAYICRCDECYKLWERRNYLAKLTVRLADYLKEAGDEAMLCVDGSFIAVSELGVFPKLHENSEVETCETRVGISAPDAHDIAEGTVIDEHHDDAIESLDIGSLKKLLDDWAKKQEVVSWFTDGRRIDPVDIPAVESESH